MDVKMYGLKAVKHRGQAKMSMSVSMSMSIIDLYSTESWSISTALCELSGSNERGSFSVIVWSCCWWALGRGDCPVASSKLLDWRPDDRKCWADNVVQSGDVEWLTVNDVGLECLRRFAEKRQWKIGQRENTATEKTATGKNGNGKLGNGEKRQPDRQGGGAENCATEIRGWPLKTRRLPVERK